MHSFPCAAIKVVAFAGWGGVHVENAVHDDFGSLTAFSSLRYLYGCCSTPGCCESGVAITSPSTFGRTSCSLTTSSTQRDLLPAGETDLSPASLLLSTIASESRGAIPGRVLGRVLLTTRAARS